MPKYLKISSLPSIFPPFKYILTNLPKVIKIWCRGVIHDVPKKSPKIIAHKNWWCICMWFQQKSRCMHGNIWWQVSTFLKIYKKTWCKCEPLLWWVTVFWVLVGWKNDKDKFWKISSRNVLACLDYFVLRAMMTKIINIIIP